MYPFYTQKLLPQYSNIPYTPLRDLSPHRNLSSRPLSVLIFKILAVIAAILGLVFVTRPLYAPRLGHSRDPVGPIPAIPTEFRTVGLVFYGRRSRVEVLDCYLKV